MAHGNVECFWQNNSLKVNVLGPFNEQGVLNSIHKIKLFVNENKGTSCSWNRLEIWNEEVLASPEVISQAKDIYDWYEKNGCKSAAIVVCNPIQQHVIENMLGIKALVFYELKQAIEWLDNTT